MPLNIILTSVSLHLISYSYFFGFRKFPQVSLVADEHVNKERRSISRPRIGKWGKWVDKGVSPTPGWLPKRERDHTAGRVSGKDRSTMG